MRRIKIKPLNIFSILLVTSPLALLSPVALSQATLMIDAGPCLSLEAAVERYSCYERQASNALNGSLSSQSAPVSVAPAVRPVTRASTTQATTTPSTASPAVIAPPAPAAVMAPARVSESQFGLVEKENKDGEITTELFSAIASIEDIIPGRQHIITLENGQVWKQTRADSKVRLTPGQEVRVYPSRWGDDYRMSIIELKSFIQVSRVR